MDERTSKRTLVEIDQSAVVRCDRAIGPFGTNRYRVDHLCDEKRHTHPKRALKQMNGEPWNGL